MMRFLLLVSALLAWATAARAATPAPIVWRPVDAAAAPPERAAVLPPGALLAGARSGEVLRIAAKARPQVGRLWASGGALAYVDESDRLIADGDAAWTFVVPLGAHEAVVVIPSGGAAVTLQRAEHRDPGYAWEVYEDALVAWADGHAGGAPPPEPPSPVGLPAWIEARAAGALLDAAGAADAGGRDVAAAVALEAIAVARPLASPYYRAAGAAPLPERWLHEGRAVTLTLTGPVYVAVTGRAPRPAAWTPVLAVSLNGRPVAGGRLPGGPVAGPAADPEPGAFPATFVVRVPAGRHRVEIVSRGGAAYVAAYAVRKREHVGDALSGDESLDGRAAGAAHEAAGADGPAAALVTAEARRLAGDRAGAARAFAALTAEGPDPVRVYAAWRLGELTLDADAAERLFAFAADRAGKLPAAVRGAVVAAVAQARARRAIRDDRPGVAAAALAEVPLLWGDPLLAPVVAGADGDAGGGAARLGATIASGPPLAARALRRAWFDRTEWTAGEPAADAIPVLTRDDAGSCADDVGDAVVLLGREPLTIDVPPHPLGGDRFRLVKIVALSHRAPALDAVVEVDGTDAPVPTVEALEEHFVALRPGRRTLTARGAAKLFVAPPPGARIPPRNDCVRFRRRRFQEVGRDGRALPLGAPAGALVGLELRATPGDGKLVSGVIEVDGIRRPVRYLAPRDPSSLLGRAGEPVAGGVILDFIAADPRTLRIARTDGGAGTWLARPLVRTTRAAAPPPGAPPVARTGVRLAEARRLVVANRRSGDLEVLRGLGVALRDAGDDAERARIHLARATVLAAMGRWALAEEDVREAARLDPEQAPEYAALLDDMERYVDAVDGPPGYAADPAAPLLHDLRDDAATRSLAGRAREGDVESARALVRRERAAVQPSPTGALALAARYDAAVGDYSGAASAYGELAERFPDRPELRAAEAGYRLDAAAEAPSAGPNSGALATRALVSALRAGDAPGAAAARARGLEATRWRRIAHADASAGTRRDGDGDAGAATGAGAPPTAILGDRDIAAALVAPALDPATAFWLEPGQVARAVIVAPRAVGLRVEAACADLRPAAATRRRAPDACRLAVTVDGAPRPLLPGVQPLGELAAGPHVVEIILAPGGADVLAAVRLLADRPLRGAAPLAGVNGVWLVPPRMARTRWLAEPGDPAVVTVLGPTALRLELAPARPGDPREAVTVVEDGGAELARFEPGAAAEERIVLLPEERAYRLIVTPAAGRVAVAADVREDRARPRPRLASLVSAPVAGQPTPLPDPGPTPAAPPTLFRRLPPGDGAGTITLTAGLRDHALGERDTATERGGRYGEVTLTYRRRAGDLWWQVGGLGRLRLGGTPTGGLGVGAFWRAIGPLRLQGSALGLTQSTPTGVAVTTWFDARAAARLPLGGDWFLTPSFDAVLRLGRIEPPGGESIDPDVWSRFDVDHRRALRGQVRLDYEPFLDLRVVGWARATSNMDLASIDRTSLFAGVTGAVGRLVWGAGVELEHRFADDDRPDGRTRTAARLAGAYSIWRGDDGRLSLQVSGTARPGERSDAFFGVAYDWTFGRGLRDYAPPELGFAGQLGPYQESSQESP